MQRFKGKLNFLSIGLFSFHNYKQSCMHVYAQPAQAQYESLSIHTCGFRREHKGFVWEFREKIKKDQYSLEFSIKYS